MIEDNSCAENVSVKRHQVWLEGVDEESCLVSVDVQTVPLQQLLLVPPALWPVLCQLLHLRRKWPGCAHLVWMGTQTTLMRPRLSNIQDRCECLPYLNPATFSSFCSTMSDRFPSRSSLRDGLRLRCCQSREQGGKKRSVKKTCGKNVTFLTMLSNLLPPTGLKMSSRGVPY